MNLLVVINSKGQDIELGIEIDRVMNTHFWTPVKDFDFTYTKEVENKDIDDLISGIKDDVETAITQAEWEKASYLFKIGGYPAIIV